MPGSIQVSSRGFPLPPWWKDKIEAKMRRLDKVDGRITHCRAVIDAPPRHQRHGRSYKLRLAIELPRAFIVIDREAAGSLDEAIETAFDAAERRLEERTRRQRTLRHERHFQARA